MTIPGSRFWRRKLRGALLASRGRGYGKGGQILPSHMEPQTWFTSDQMANKERGRANEEHVVQEKVFSSPTRSPDLVIRIKDKLDQVPITVKPNSCLSHCIFRVPRNLREVDPKAYSPQVVSIGPFHRGKTCLKDMERHKWRLLYHVLQRTGHSLEVYLEAMMDLEENTRRCYAKCSLCISSDEFVEMMLLDACFVLELLRVSVKGFIHCGYSWGDPIFTSRGLLPCIQRDLLMLENQLPLFVLDRLSALSCELTERESVSELALQFFDPVIPGCKNNAIDPEYPGLHFVHIVRQSLIPSTNRTFGCGTIKQEYQPRLMMHGVTSLRDSGVKFQKKNTDKFTDIEFKNGVLHIPRLVIHDSTKAIFLNLMVFEQCYPHCCNYITSYLSFLNGLINSPRDVGYLCHAGIIHHGLGSLENVAYLFNNICKEVAFDINDCYLSGVSTDVNRYFHLKWHRWRATLKHEYFRNPWAIVSIFVAFLIIGLTALQTFYSVFGYYYPS